MGGGEVRWELVGLRVPKLKTAGAVWGLIERSLVLLLFRRRRVCCRVSGTGL